MKARVWLPVVAAVLTAATLLATLLTVEPHQLQERLRFYANWGLAYSGWALGAALVLSLLANSFLFRAWRKLRTRGSTSPKAALGPCVFVSETRNDERNRELLGSALKGASEIRALGIANNILTTEASVDFYREFLVSRKGRLKLMFLDPAGASIRDRERAENRKKGTLSFGVQHNLEDMQKYLEICGRQDADVFRRVEIRLYDFDPHLNCLLVDGRMAFVHTTARTRGASTLPRSSSRETPPRFSASSRTNGSRCGRTARPGKSPGRASDPPMPRGAAVRSVARVARRLYEAGFGRTRGNVSARLADSILITPKGAAADGAGFLDEEQVCEITLDGVCLSGGQPSSETEVHLALYERVPGCFGIVHAHPPYLIAALSLGTPLPRATASAASFGDPLLVPTEATPAGPAAVAQLIRERTATDEGRRRAAGKYGTAVLIPGHGVFCASSSPERALYFVFKREENAKVAFLSLQHRAVLQ